MTAGFWDWSVAIYRQGDVEKTTIQLQDDFDLNVNVVLWCCWCAHHYEEIPEFALRKAIEETSNWTNKVTGPIRSARRASKEQSAIENDLYNTLKNAELMAEQVEQTSLALIAENQLKPAQRDIPLSCARRNLSRYIALLGTVRQPGFSIELIETLLAAIFDNQQTN